MTKTAQKTKTLDEGKLKQKASARQYAKAIIDLINEAFRNENEGYKEAFWDELTQWIEINRPDVLHPEQNKIGPRGEIVPYRDRECRLFEARTMRFGKYVGVLCADVPLTYFDYMCGLDKNFMAGMAIRYLKNDKVAERLRELLDK